MRTTRTSRTALTACAAALLAATTLTACQGNDALIKEPSPAGAASAVQPSGGTTDSGNAQPVGHSPSGGTAAPTAKGGAGDGNSKAGGGKGGAEAGFVACAAGSTRIVATKVERPVNHMLLTVTNTGKRACDVYLAPLLRFDDEQAATQIVEDSKPQAVTTLAPGESAYAGVTLSSATGEAAHGYKPEKLELHFAARSGSGSAGAPVKVTLPADTYKDDSAAVTYWLTSMQDALNH
ncbi:hypothetical protein ADK55_17510 [Streptomyces sp. WM4235]|uniref:DUF4232 domain-containing protein n=1 Tax=Streptomyces sp. WM4235 TaxID=1415551 RepID=UPI0006AE7038|nr:DUF4232 domain-containing protein [Streptomyces sp. WM4235]KOU52072.1 hypothetical protein ADK55_17510 [Streptomyces sp. WM4235]